MKIIANIKRRLWTASILLLSVAMVSCIKDNTENCDVDYQLYLKVVDQNGNDITEHDDISKVDVFVFDNVGKYVETISLNAEQIKQRIPIKVSKDGTIVVWGNIYDRQTVSEMDEVATINSSTVKLHLNGEGYTVTPDDIFYGIENLQQNGRQTIDKEVVISRKIARMNITVRGLQKTENDEDYYFVVSSKHDGYTFRGEPTQSSVNIKELGAYGIYDDFASVAPFNLTHYPQQAKQGVAVTIFRKDGTKITTVEEDINDKPIIPKAGEMLNVLIDLTIPGTSVQIVVTPWDEKHQWVEQYII